MRLSDDRRRFRRTVREFVTEEIGVDYCRERYRNREYPHEFYDTVVAEGWLGTHVPEAYGGRGGGHLDAVLLLEGLGTYGYDFAVPVVTTATATTNLLEYGTDAQRERYLPDVLDGSCRFSVGVTEPQSGSDAAGLSTRAERQGEEYVVDGEKTYQSGAGVAGNRVHCYVRTDPDGGKYDGISALLVPVDAPGVAVEELPLVTRKAVGTYRLSFEGVRVPVEDRLGEEGDGWSIMTDHLAREHTYMAASMVGNAQTVVETALEGAADRRRFGKRVVDFQAIKHRLADMQTEVDAARLLVYHAAAELDAGTASRRLAAEAKLKAGVVLREVSTEGMQVLGGAGFDPANDMERYWREGMSATIAGGTSEIQRSVVGNALLEDYRSE